MGTRALSGYSDDDLRQALDDTFQRHQGNGLTIYFLLHNTLQRLTVGVNYGEAYDRLSDLLMAQLNDGTLYRTAQFIKRASDRLAGTVVSTDAGTPVKKYVKCIQGKSRINPMYDLIQGQIYEVENETGLLSYQLVGTTLSYDRTRFIQVSAPTQASSAVAPTPSAVNDYECPTCHNTRCSKAEKKCWKCGGQL